MGLFGEHSCEESDHRRPWDGEVLDGREKEWILDSRGGRHCNRGFVVDEFPDSVGDSFANDEKERGPCRDSVNYSFAFEEQERESSWDSMILKKEMKIELQENY